METDRPDPDLRQESACKGITKSGLHSRGLTPRNISPEKRSRNIIVKCKQENTGDEIETYASIVDRKLRGLNRH